MEFWAKKRDGEFKLVKEKAYREALENLTEGDYVISIEPRRPMSSQMRRFYRGVVIPAFSRYSGEGNRETLHEYLLEKFAPRDSDNEVIRTSQMSSNQAIEYVSSVRAYLSSEYGIGFQE